MPSTLRDNRRRPLAIAIYDDGRQQRDIAEAAGIAGPTLSGIVSGRIRDPKPETRAAIARALGRDVDDLFPEYAAETVR